jgi:phosphate transport system substrate-binding protein
VENWQVWGGLPGVPQLVSRESASGEFLYLQNNVMREIRTSLNASLATSSDIMVQYVSQDPLAVGYLSTTRLSKDVRAVGIDGIPPSEETIAAQIYPLIRVIYVVTNGEPEEPERSFVQWMLEGEGQLLLKNQGFVKNNE